MLWVPGTAQAGGREGGGYKGEGDAQRYPPPPPGIKNYSKFRLPLAAAGGGSPHHCNK